MSQVSQALATALIEGRKAGTVAILSPLAVYSAPAGMAAGQTFSAVAEKYSSKPSKMEPGKKSPWFLCAVSNSTHKIMVDGSGCSDEQLSALASGGTFTCTVSERDGLSGKAFTADFSSLAVTANNAAPAPVVTI